MKRGQAGLARLDILTGAYNLLRAVGARDDLPIADIGMGCDLHQDLAMLQLLTESYFRAQSIEKNRQQPDSSRN